MTARPLPPVEFLRECFRYVPETGEVFWRARPESHFVTAAHCTTWNRKYAGRLAGTRDAEGYVRLTFVYMGRERKPFAHSVIYALENQGRRPDFVDHRNVDTVDNRRTNLRPATRSQNNANRRGWSKLGLPKGVSVSGRRFSASAKKDGVTWYLGAYDTPAEAHAAYCARGRELHGEFFNSGAPKPSVFD